MHPNVTRVVEAARGAGLEVEVRRFPEGTRTAEDAARAIGCEAGGIGGHAALRIEDHARGLGATRCYTAHRELEQIVLDRRALALKDQVAQRYADLVYEGRWWSTEREALDALVDRTQQRVTGSVRLKLYKGNAIIAGRSTPYPLYDAGLASFGNDGSYDHADAAGFIRLLSLPTRAEAIQAAAHEAAHLPPTRTATTPRGVIQHIDPVTV